MFRPNIGLIDPGPFLGVRIFRSFKVLFIVLPNHYTVVWVLYEPRHDKTNKMAVRPAKTQISLGIDHEESLGP